MQRKVFNHANCHLRERKKKHPGVSMTIPGKAFSIDVLLKKHKAGMAVPVASDPIYEEDDAPSNGVNPLTLDPVDRQQMAIEMKKRIQDLELKRQGYEKQQKQKQAEIAAEQAAFKEWWSKQKERSNESPAP